MRGRSVRGGVLGGGVLGGGVLGGGVLGGGVLGGGVLGGGVLGGWIMGSALALLALQGGDAAAEGQCREAFLGSWRCVHEGHPNSGAIEASRSACERLCEVSGRDDNVATNTGESPVRFTPRANPSYLAAYGLGQGAAPAAVGKETLASREAFSRLSIADVERSGSIACTRRSTLGRIARRLFDERDAGAFAATVALSSEPLSPATARSQAVVAQTVATVTYDENQNDCRVAEIIPADRREVAVVTADVNRPLYATVVFHATESASFDALGPLTNIAGAVSNNAIGALTVVRPILEPVLQDSFSRDAFYAYGKQIVTAPTRLDDQIGLDVEIVFDGQRLVRFGIEQRVDVYGGLEDRSAASLRDAAARVKPLVVQNPQIKPTDGTLAAAFALATVDLDAISSAPSVVELDAVCRSIRATMTDLDFPSRAIQRALALAMSAYPRPLELEPGQVGANACLSNRPFDRNRAEWLRIRPIVELPLSCPTNGDDLDVYLPRALRQARAYLAAPEAEQSDEAFFEVYVDVASPRASYSGDPELERLRASGSAPAGRLETYLLGERQGCFLWLGDQAAAKSALGDRNAQCSYLALVGPSSTRRSKTGWNFVLLQAGWRDLEPRLQYLESPTAVEDLLDVASGAASGYSWPRYCNRLARDVAARAKRADAADDGGVRDYARLGQ